MNNKISALLERSRREKKETDQGAKTALLDPFANYGQNFYCNQYFNEAQFKLEKQAGQENRKIPKDSFTMMPKYVQI